MSPNKASHVPRILLVSRNFPPTTGGLERFLYNTYLQLEDNYDVAFVGARGAEKYLKPQTPYVNTPILPMVSFLIRTQLNAFRMARKFKPDLVIAGSGITAPAAILAARVVDARSLCFVYGLDLIVENFIYQKFFVPAIRRCDTIISISQNTSRLAKNAGVRSERIKLLHPGVELPGNVPQPDVGAFKRRFGLEENIILLSVGRLSQRKGITEFITFALPQLVSQHPDIKLVIIGSEPHEALKHSPGQLERIKNAIHARGLEDHVVLLGQVDEETLRDAYCAGKLMVFPVIDLPGDMEGFGMVAIEAAAHGLPTISFAVGGVPDAVKEGVSGYLLKSGDYEGFVKAVLHYIDYEDAARWSDQCRRFAEEFTWEKFGRRLREIINDTAHSVVSRQGSGNDNRATK